MELSVVVIAVLLAGVAGFVLGFVAARKRARRGVLRMTRERLDGIRGHAESARFHLNQVAKQANELESKLGGTGKRGRSADVYEGINLESRPRGMEKKERKDKW